MKSIYKKICQFLNKKFNDNRLIITQILLPIFNVGLIITLFILIEDELTTWFDKYLLKFFDFDSTIFSILALGFTIILTCIHAIFKWKNKNLYPNYLIASIILFGFIFCKYAFFSTTYIFTELIHGITYMGIIVCMLVILFLEEGYFRYSKIKKLLQRIKLEKEATNDNKYNDIINIIDDSPIKDGKNDLFNYQKEVKKLAHTIQELDYSKTWSIGITAPWGGGKTSFINLILKELPQSDFMIIKFNPRKSKDVTELQEDFLVTLNNELSPYNPYLSLQLKKYIKSLQLIDNKHILSTLLAIHHVEDPKKQKEKISKTLETLLPKHVIVIIDDLDRITTNEIIEIFKLIDVNADFRNLIYLTAYDKTYINTLLGDLYKNEKYKYSDKFFNLEYNIPIRSYTIQQTFLYNQIIQELKPTQEESQKYAEAIGRNTKLMETYLTTMRDIKRFFNFYITDYKEIQGEVNIEDFLLLTIIKYKDYDFFYKLYQQKDIITTQDTNDYLTLDQHYTDDKIYYDILKHLFPNNYDNKNISPIPRINNSRYWYNYFILGIYEKLTQKEMRDVLFQNFYESIPHLNKWIQNNDINNFIEFINIILIHDLPSKEIFKSLIQKLLYIGQVLKSTYNIGGANIYYFLVDTITTESISKIKSKYQFEDEEYKQFIYDCYKGKYPTYAYYFTRQILINIINNEYKDKPIIFTKEDIFNINKENLKEYLDQTDILDEQIISMLYSCISHKENNRFILDSECCQFVKERIIQSPQYYIENLLRLGITEDDRNPNAIAYEPFLKQIFTDLNDFKTLIFDHKNDSLNKIQQVRNFWDMFELNDYKAIGVAWEIDSNVRDLLNTNLDLLHNRLIQLQGIEKDFNKLEKTRKKYKEDHKNTSTLTKQYTDLKEKIENTKLYITYRKKLIDKINNVIKELEQVPQN